MEDKRCTAAGLASDTPHALNEPVPSNDLPLGFGHSRFGFTRLTTRETISVVPSAAQSSLLVTKQRRHH